MFLRLILIPALLLLGGAGGKTFAFTNGVLTVVSTGLVSLIEHL